VEGIFGRTDLEDNNSDLRSSFMKNFEVGGNILQRSDSFEPCTWIPVTEEKEYEEVRGEEVKGEEAGGEGEKVEGEDPSIIHKLL
jgi:hypothetical protein